MDELEYALETIGHTDFEDLAMAFLRSQDYEVHESGSQAADGGWDAKIEAGERNGIAHVSTRKDFKRKIREDAEKVSKLEKETDFEYDIFVFLTNQDVSGRQELDLEQEIEEEYGWKTKIIHRRNIVGELRSNHPDLAMDFLHVDLGSGRDDLEDLLELRNERINQIRERSGDASDIELGPVAVLHVIPTGILSRSSGGYTGRVPDPPLFWKLTPARSEVRGKASYSFDSSSRNDPGKAYGVLRNDGLYESVYHLGFYQRDREIELPLNVSHGTPGLDAYVVITVRRTLARLQEMGYSGRALVSLAFLDAPGLKGDLSNRTGMVRMTQELGTDQYVTDPLFVSIGGSEFYEEIEDLLNEIWRQLGIPDGTSNIEDGSWEGNDVQYNREYLVGGES